MPVTNIRGQQILNATIQREDLDITTASKAVVAKIVQGTGISLSSTGVDSGTGDVTISLNTTYADARYILNQTSQQASSNFNISGNGTIGGNLSVTGTTTLSTISALGSTASVFLTHSSGVIQSRTAAQVLSDIGALSTGAASTTYVPYGGYVTRNAPFGELMLGHQLINNVFYQAASRFTVTHNLNGAGATTLTGNSLFNGFYDQQAYAIPNGQNVIFDIDFTTKGNGVNGITYTGGYVYIHFYSTVGTPTITGRWQNNSASWTTITFTNIGTGSYTVARAPIGASNYMTHLEITIANAAGGTIHVSQIEYVMSREGQFAAGVVNKFENNTLWTDMSWQNSSNSTTASIAATGIASFTNATSTGAVLTVTNTTTSGKAAIFNGSNNADGASVVTIQRSGIASIDFYPSVYDGNRSQVIQFTMDGSNKRARFNGASKYIFDGLVSVGGTGADATTAAKFESIGSITAASAIARGVYFGNTLVAAANNDVLVALDINPTFTLGAFTGVSRYALRTTIGDVMLDLSSSSSRTVNVKMVSNLSYGDYVSGLMVGEGATTGDMNISLYVDGTNNIGFIQAATRSSSYQNLSLNPNSGHVGIGAGATILTALDVRSQSNGAISPLSGVPTGTTTALFGNTGTNGVLAIGHDNASHAWLQGRSRLGDGSTTDIWLNPLGGKVGVGTSATPIGVFDVKVATNQHLVIRSGNGGATTEIYAVNDAGSTFQDLLFNGSTGMIIKGSNYNVGIGTSSPNFKLELVGSGTSESGSYYAARGADTAAAPLYGLYKSNGSLGAAFIYFGSTNGFFPNIAQLYTNTGVGFQIATAGVVGLTINTSQAASFSSTVTIGSIGTNTTATDILVPGTAGVIEKRSVSSFGFITGISIGAIGSSPNANGATFSSNTLVLQPASQTYGGIVTAGTSLQEFSGAKKFYDGFDTHHSMLSGANIISYNGAETLYTQLYYDALWFTDLTTGAYSMQLKQTTLTAPQIIYLPNASGTVALTSDLTGYAVSGHTHTFASLTSKPTTLAGYGITDGVVANTAITGATKTKITYDAKGLVTAGTDLIASDIPDLSATYALSSHSHSTLGDLNIDSGAPKITWQRSGIDKWKIGSTSADLFFIHSHVIGGDVLTIEAATGYITIWQQPPTYSSGSYYVLVTNASTGRVEKISGSGLTASSVANALSISAELISGGATTYDGSAAKSIAIQAGSVTNAMLAGSIAASKLVGTDIATVGTITAGTWNGTAIATAYIANDAVTYAKIQDVTSQKLLGRYAGTSGDAQEITVGTGLTLDTSTGVLSTSSTGGGLAQTLAAVSLRI